MNQYVIILAAGQGKRLGLDVPKCFAKINDRFIFEYSLQLFQSIPIIKKIFLVVPKEYKQKLIFRDKRIKVVVGGKTRNESFENAVKKIKDIKLSDKIIIHDAARINVKLKDILNVINHKSSYGTLCYIGKKNNRDLRIGKHNIQTPQFCTYSIYKYAKKNKNGRDLFTYLNLKPTKDNFIISFNKQNNWKITYQKDLEKAKSL